MNIQEVLTKRGRAGGGFNPNRFVELVGGREVPSSFFEPDAKTFRGSHYYNVRTNVLYKKVKAKHPMTGNVKCFWQSVSEL